MRSVSPLPVFEAPTDREVVWKNLCMIGPEKIECLVEMSQNKTKFYISAFDCMNERYYGLSLFKRQAEKILKVCDNSYE